ncbi:uncharacterized protein LOC116300862 [Actinia tenebrosa]|uniref:Uncharacterized protein LOC116300862 n=1 Tax=Actinia tenebrosa TaxID=6105 RepID=A0A6P8IG23_ACTTE|nr:uncharacterized protein LOC116300862 [Actinia tenebrosa]
MYRSIRCHAIVRRIFYGKKPYSSPLCTATDPNNLRKKEETKRTDLQERVLHWDENLPIPDPPSLKCLVDFLVRRRTLSCTTKMKLGFHRLVVQTASGILGLKGAHKRMCELHSQDPINNCWYAPANHGDTFGIRHDEVYFHQDIIPSQPVTSYGVLIRGSPRHAGTSVEGGIAENETPLADNGTVSSEAREEAMVSRAASLIDGLMKARDFYNSVEFDQDTIKGSPLSMQWYNYIFSCSMQFRPGSIERYKAPEENSKHIIVMVQGHMYKLDLIRTNEHGKERRLTGKQLRKQIRLILKMDATRDLPSTPMAVITSLTPSERCQEEQRLKCLSQRNATNLALIRDALFTVALDPDDFPRSANEAMFALYSGNFVNRWYDKSVQLVVFGNGVAGFVNNYIAGMTGTVGTNFVRIAVGSESLFEEETTTDDADDSTYPGSYPITWDDTTDEYFRRSIDYKIQTSRESGPFKPFSTDVFQICRGFSFEEMCKGHGATPGGVFQAGMQLALGMIAGRPMSVNEVVSIRNLRFGGMTFMDSSMADMKQFVQQACKLRSSGNQTLIREEHLRLKTLLKKALRSYKDEVMRYKKGEINLWHLDSLYRTLGLSNRLPFRNAPKPNKSLKEVSVEYLRAPWLDILPPQIAENVTSNPCWYPEIEAIGRPGVKCILPPKSMALHYMFGRKAISITVNANPQHPCYGKEVTFVKELEQSLEFVQDLLDS